MDDRRSKNRRRFARFFAYFFGPPTPMLAPSNSADFQALKAQASAKAAAMDKLANFKAIVRQHQASANEAERDALKAEGLRLWAELVDVGAIRLHDFHARILQRIEDAGRELTTDAGLLAEFGGGSWGGCYRDIEELGFVHRMVVRGCTAAVVMLTDAGRRFLERVKAGELTVRPPLKVASG